METKYKNYVFEFDGDFTEFDGQPVLGLLEVGGSLSLLLKHVFEFLDLYAQSASVNT
jgi:hypothetical protein